MKDPLSCPTLTCWKRCYDKVTTAAETGISEKSVRGPAAPELRCILSDTSGDTGCREDVGNGNPEHRRWNYKQVQSFGKESGSTCEMTNEWGNDSPPIPGSAAEQISHSPRGADGGGHHGPWLGSRDVHWQRMKTVTKPGLLARGGSVQPLTGARYTQTKTGAKKQTVLSKRKTNTEAEADL